MFQQKMKVFKTKQVLKMNHVKKAIRNWFLDHVLILVLRSGKATPPHLKFLN